MKAKFIFLGLLVASSHCYAQNNGESLLLYSNNFNTGNVISNTSTCSPNIKHNNVNALFKGTGSGLYTNVLFGQNASVEVADNIDPPGHIFDPQSKGGKYSITMQTANPENDLVWITFQAKDLNSYNFINFNFDVSATDILTSSRCGISGTVTTPIVVVSAYLHSSSTLSQSNVLSRDTLIGLPPLETYTNRKYDTYNWKNVTARLPIDRLTTENGYVSMLIDVIQGSYTAVDNFVITSSMIALPVNLKYFTGYNLGDEHVLEWNVDNAYNFNYFEIETANINEPDLFTSLAIVNYDETKSLYNFKNTANKSLLYRLKFVDTDGAISYSAIVKLDSAVKKMISLVPNPVKDILHINTTTALDIRLYDLYGNLKITSFADHQNNQIDMSNLMKGIYVLHVTHQGTQQKDVIKIIKD